MKKYVRWFWPGVLAVVSAVLVVMAGMSGLFPPLFFALLFLVVLAVFGASLLLATSPKAGLRAAGAVFSVIASAAFIFVAVYLGILISTVDKIAGAQTEIRYIEVRVRAEDRAAAIADLGGHTLGFYEGADAEFVGQVMDEIRETNGESLKEQSFDSPHTMAQKLLDSGIDAAVMNQAYASLIEDMIPDFSSKTRVIYVKAFETELGEDLAWFKDSKGEQKNYSVTEDPCTILVSGIDVEGPISTVSRSDVNILMTVNPKKHSVLLTNTPRDYYVPIPDISRGARDKLTHAGVYGVHATMRTLSELYEVDVPQYVRVNFSSLISLVDVLGGVDVNSEVAFTAGGYTFVQGLNHMDGAQALAFSRQRYAFADGDNQRGKNQMAVMTAIISKLQSKAILKNPAGLLQVIAESMQTSYTRSQIMEVISWELAGGYRWTVDRQAVSGRDDQQQTFSMPGTPLYVMWPDEEAVKAAAKRIREQME